MTQRIPPRLRLRPSQVFQDYSRANSLQFKSEILPRPRLIIGYPADWAASDKAAELSYKSGTPLEIGLSETQLTNRG